LDELPIQQAGWRVRPVWMAKDTLDAVAIFDTNEEIDDEVKFGFRLADSTKFRLFVQAFLRMMNPGVTEVTPMIVSVEHQ